MDVDGASKSWGEFVSELDGKERPGEWPDVEAESSVVHHYVK